MLVIGILAAIAVVFMLTGTILQATLFKNRIERIEPYGQIVSVSDGTMHLRSIGDGVQTVVLLPGMGVGLPSADMAPLMRKLGEKYTAVIVEYFGTGFSSTTSIPRSSGQYVEEIRSALAAADFKPPYVLMAHSISSVFAEHYAAEYPEEVKAVISLDGTSTAHYEKTPSIVKVVLPVVKFQQTVGTLSILAVLTTNKKNLLTKGYTKQEIEDMITFAGFSMNDTLLQQIAESGEFIGQTLALPYPASVPYFKVISKKTYETPNKQLHMTPQEYQTKHLERIGPQVKFEILEGSHFIYQNNATRIVQITDEVRAGNVR